MRRAILCLAFLGCSKPALAPPPPPSPVAPPAPAAWRWERPLPQGNPLLAAHVTGATTTAVGMRGAAVISRDGGASWTLSPTGSTADLVAIDGADTTLHAVGSGGTILRSTDGGASFETRPSPTTMDLVDVSAGPHGVVCALARDGQLLRSTDAGDLYELLPGPGDTYVARAVACPSSDVVLIATEVRLYRSDDGGETFGPAADLVEPVERLIVRAGTVYAAAITDVRYATVEICNSCVDAGYRTVAVYRSTDLGLSWEQRVLEDLVGGTTGWRTPRPLPIPPAPPQGAMWSGGWGGFELPRATPGWQRFRLDLSAGEPTVIEGQEAVAPPTDTTILFAVASAGGHAVAVGGDGHIVVRDPATAAWSAAPSGTERRLNDVADLGGDRFVAVGDHGTTLLSTDGGQRFTTTGNSTLDDLITVWGTGDLVLAAGSHGVVLRSEDGGATWRKLAALDQDTGVDLWGSSSADLYMATFYGKHLRSTDRGETWTDVGESIDGVSGGIWGSGPDDVYLVGWGGRIYHSADRGRSWQTRASGTDHDLIGIWGHGADDVWVAGTDVLLHSTDGGFTWASKPAPTSATVMAIGGDADALYLLAAGGQILRR